MGNRIPLCECICVFKREDGREGKEEHEKGPVRGQRILSDIVLLDSTKVL